MQNSDDLLTAKEVAAMFRWIPNTVYIKACRGKLPSLKIGGSLRFKRSEIEKLIQERPAIASAGTPNI